MEQEFHKDGQVRYAYKPDQAVRLVADGWVEGKAKASPDPDKEEESRADRLRASAVFKTKGGDE